MKRKRKQGFTLVELLIVIAILAVLATAAILGYSAFIKKANISNDKAIVEQMNKALMANEALGNTARYCDEAVDQAIEAGFILENLTPSTSGFHFAYDQKYNRFMLLKEDHTFEYGDNNHTDVEVEPWNIFVVVGSQEEIDKATKEVDGKPRSFSIYVRQEFVFTEDSNNTITIGAGFDAGKCLEIKTVNYKNEVAEQVVGIRTNGGTLSVDGEHDTVTHYGFATIVDVKDVKVGTYNEDGTVGRLIYSDESGAIKFKENAKVYCYMNISTDPGADVSETTKEEGATVFTNVSSAESVAAAENEANRAKADANGTHNVTLDEVGKVIVSACANHNSDYDVVTIVDKEYVLCKCCGGFSLYVAGNKVSVEDNDSNKEAEIPASIEPNKIIDYQSPYNKTAYSYEIALYIEGQSIEYTTLKDFKDKVNKGNRFSGYTVSLLKDIQIDASEWTTIGIYGESWDSYFSGTFEGNNKTISINYNGNIDADFAFFGATFNATIQNLSFKFDINTSSDYSINVVDIYSQSTTFKNIKCSGNITAYGPISTFGYSGNKDEFIDCKSKVNMTSYADTVGSNAKLNYDTITKKYTYSFADGQAPYVIVGGYIGQGNNCSFKNCDFSGKIEIKKHNVVENYPFIGAFVAYNRTNESSFKTCSIEGYSLTNEYGSIGIVNIEGAKLAYFNASDNNTLRNYVGFSSTAITIDETQYASSTFICPTETSAYVYDGVSFVEYVGLNDTGAKAINMVARKSLGSHKVYSKYLDKLLDNLYGATLIADVNINYVKGHDLTMFLGNYSLTGSMDIGNKSLTLNTGTLKLDSLKCGKIIMKQYNKNAEPKIDCVSVITNEIDGISTNSSIKITNLSAKSSEIWLKTGTYTIGTLTCTTLKTANGSSTSKTIITTDKVNGITTLINKKARTGSSNYTYYCILKLGPNDRTHNISSAATYTVSCDEAGVYKFTK